MELIWAMPTSMEPLALRCTTSGRMADSTCKMARKTCGLTPCCCAAGITQRSAEDAKGLCGVLGVLALIVLGAPVARQAQAETRNHLSKACMSRVKFRGRHGVQGGDSKA